MDEIAHIADVHIDFQVDLDHQTMTLKSILDLKRGSVIRLTRSAGDNIEFLLGGSLVGYGEIVVIEERMGVRITDFTGEE